MATTKEQPTKKETKLSNLNLSEDEKLMAAISHVGILLGGILIALIVWLTQKDKSKYVNFQSKQALVYQIVIDILLLVLCVVTFVLIFVLIGFLLIPVVFLLALCAVLYGLYGAYKTYKGEDFKYIIIGDMLSE